MVRTSKVQPPCGIKNSPFRMSGTTKNKNGVTKQPTVSRKSTERSLLTFGPRPPVCQSTGYPKPKLNVYAIWKTNCTAGSLAKTKQSNHCPVHSVVHGLG